MPSESFYFGLQKHIIDKLAQKQGKQLSREEISKIAKDYLIDLAEGKRTLTPDEQYKILRNKKLELDIKIKEKDLLYYETFHKSPTDRARRAIRDGVEVENITHFDRTENFKVEHFNGKYYFECKQEGCTVVATVYDAKVGLAEMEKHLSVSHGLGLYKGESIQ